MKRSLPSIIHKIKSTIVHPAAPYPAVLSFGLWYLRAKVNRVPITPILQKTNNQKNLLSIYIPPSISKLIRESYNIMRDLSNFLEF